MWEAEPASPGTASPVGPAARGATRACPLAPGRSASGVPAADDPQGE
jgi:hypothetical protein